MSDNLSIADKKNIAYTMYMQGGNTQKHIAATLRVSEKTVSSWVKKGRWEELRDNSTLSRKSLLTDSYKQLRALNEEIAKSGGVITKSQSDAKATILREIKSLSDNPIHVYVECFEDFVEYLAKVHPQEASTFSPLMLEFLETRLTAK